jgi:hypothetical protein
MKAKTCQKFQSGDQSKNKTALTNHKPKQLPPQPRQTKEHHKIRPHHNSLNLQLSQQAQQLVKLKRNFGTANNAVTWFIVRIHRTFAPSAKLKGKCLKK